MEVCQEKKDKEVIDKLYVIGMHNGTLQPTTRKATEEVLGYSSIENKYHEVGIYTDLEFWEAVYEKAEEIKVGEYEFRTQATAFEHRAYPANVYLVKYQGKYIVNGDR